MLHELEWLMATAMEQAELEMHAGELTVAPTVERRLRMTLRQGKKEPPGESAGERPGVRLLSPQVGGTARGGADSSDAVSIEMT